MPTPAKSAPPPAKSAPLAGGNKKTAPTAKLTSAPPAKSNPTPASAASKARSAPAAAPRAKSTPAPSKSKSAPAAVSTKSARRKNTPPPAASPMGDDLGGEDDVNNDDADSGDDGAETGRKRPRGGRGDEDESGDEGEPVQVPTDEDSEESDDVHKKGNKVPKQPKPRNQTKAKSITFKEHTDSMILKVERWMNGEGVLDGVPASEASTWMSAMVVGQGSRKIEQEEARARQRSKSIEARLLLAKTQLVNALALCLDDNSVQAQNLRQMVDELNGELNFALDHAYTSDEEGMGDEERNEGDKVDNAIEVGDDDD